MMKSNLELVAECDRYDLRNEHIIGSLFLPGGPGAGERQV